MIINSFYIKNLKIKLKMLGHKTRNLAYFFPSKVPREFSPIIVFIFGMLLRIYKNFFDFHYTNECNKLKWESFTPPVCFMCYSSMIQVSFKYASRITGASEGDVELCMAGRGLVRFSEVENS